MFHSHGISVGDDDSVSLHAQNKGIKYAGVALLLPSTDTKAGKQTIGLPSHLAIRSFWAMKLIISNDYF